MLGQQPIAKRCYHQDAILWAIWLTQNDIIFNCARVSSSLQVLFRGTYWIRFWALLQKEEESPLVLEGCRALECSAMEIFTSNGWPFINQIAYCKDHRGVRP